MPTFESVLAEEHASIGSQSVDEQTLLSISPNKEDQATLRAIIDDRRWRVSSVSTCRDALDSLVSERITVIFCDAILEDGTWKDILEEVGTGSGATPLVVTSRLADASLWSEVLNLGGYDVLLKPFNPRDTVYVLRTISLQAAPQSTRMRVAGAV